MFSCSQDITRGTATDLRDLLRREQDVLWRIPLPFPLWVQERAICFQDQGFERNRLGNLPQLLGEEHIRGDRDQEPSFNNLLSQFRRPGITMKYNRRHIRALDQIEAVLLRIPGVQNERLLELLGQSHEGPERGFLHLVLNLLMVPMEIQADLADG